MYIYIYVTCICVMYIYIYIYITHIHTHIYIYIHIINSPHMTFIQFFGISQPFGRPRTPSQEAFTDCASLAQITLRSNRLGDQGVAWRGNRTRRSESVLVDLPSGKHRKNDGKIHHFQWVNPLFLWSFSIAM